MWFGLDPFNLISYRFHEQVVPIAEGFQEQAFNVRLEEQAVIDAVFLHGYTQPTIAILYEDARQCRHIRTYTISTQPKSLEPGPWKQTNVGRQASFLLAISGPVGVRGFALKVSLFRI